MELESLHQATKYLSVSLHFILPYNSKPQNKKYPNCFCHFLLIPILYHRANESEIAAAELFAKICYKESKSPRIYRISKNCEILQSDEIVYKRKKNNNTQRQ